MSLGAFLPEFWNTGEQPKISLSKAKSYIKILQALSEP